MKRKLASVQYVHDVTPIDGADRIECIHVLGWQCVAKKGEFSVGDLCVYFEIDSFLPIRDEFEFLRSSSYKNSEILGEGFRLKTVRMKGQISQGLALPLSILSGSNYNIGDDVTEELGVRKWEIEQFANPQGTVIGGIPYSIKKTSEVRVQSNPGLIDEFKGVEYYITTKLDGTSMTVFLSDDRFGVCGHNYEFADDEDSQPGTMWWYAKKHDLEKKMRDADFYGIALQGEYCGPKIQRNSLKLKEPEFYVFNVVNIDTGVVYPLSAMVDVCEEIGVSTVPIEEVGNPFMYSSVDELLNRLRFAVV